jgi:hypothetical protein
MIRRRRKTREIEFSFDSFLDVVANVVGIILRLILVAWVGARSYKIVVPTLAATLTQEEIAELPDPQDPLAPELERQRRELAEAQGHLLEQLKEWQKLRQDSTLTAEELSHLAAHVQDVDAQRKGIEDKTRQDAEFVRNAALSLKEIRERGQRVVEEIEALRKAPPSKNTLRYRTPVSREFKTEVLEFECSGGRITFIDKAKFQEEVNRAMLSEGSRILQESGRYSTTTPAVGAFRMQFHVEMNRADGKPETLSTLEPMSWNRGETAEQALADGSEFRRLIDSCEASGTEVTLWVYPDSFPLYRKLRDYMDERDFFVAARPLPNGCPVSYGSHGTVSRGQ